MTREMTMNRLIHDTVRRDLDRLHTALGSARDGDTARARQLARAYANLQDELTRHHEGEDQHIFPWLSATDTNAPALVAEMESEHHAMAAALAETRTAMDQYAATGSAAAAQQAQQSVAATTAVIERHLTHEENDLEPLVQSRVQTPEWKTIEKQLRPKSLTVTGNFFAWVQDGMSDEGRVYYNKTIPRPVTFLLSRLAGRSYRRNIAPVWAS